MAFTLPKYRKPIDAPKIEPQSYNELIKQGTDTVEMGMIYICPYCKNIEVVMSFYCRNCGKRLWVPERPVD